MFRSWPMTRVLMLLLCAAAMRAQSAEPSTLRVLSYNIHHGEGVDGKLDLQRIAEVIRTTDPAVVSLQEVDRNTTRTGQVDQPAELARLTGMHAVFEKNIDYAGGEYGNAILTKLPVLRHRNVRLPSHYDGEQRGALCVELNWHGRPLVFIATHFDYRPDECERLASAKTINELVAQYGTTPVVLAGDLNARRDSTPVALLQRMWGVAGEQEQPTFPAANPQRQIDFILMRPQAAWRVAAVRVLDQPVASDHRPLLAEMQWQGTAEPPPYQTLLTIEPSDQQPRNSEGDLLELADGRWCLVYSRFSGGTSDHAAADLAMRVSSDKGRTWSDDRIVVRREEGCNVMSVSLLRLADQRIALFYVRKRSLQDCRAVMRISTDEAASFGPPIECITDEVGYYVLNNDRVVQLPSGRLIAPVAMHNSPSQEKPDWAGRIMCYLSDDTGAIWRRSATVLTGPELDGKRTTTQEPGVVRLQDGRLMMFCRTSAGSQFLSYSEDDGDHWSPWQPSTLQSPLSPATIQRVPWSGKLLCVWNDHGGRHLFPPGKRAPLCVAVSNDDGRTWGPSRVLEPNLDGWYCYTAMAFIDQRLVLAYCAGDAEVGHLNRLKVISLDQDWIDRLGQ